MRLQTHFIALFVLALTTPSSSHAEFSSPTGIFSLGAAQDNPNTPTDERLAGIRDYPFVSGFTLRVLWKDLETSQGVYNFGVIDEAIRRAGLVGQRVNLEVLQSMPQYIIDGAGATYIDHRGGISPVPWDAFAQSRYAALQTALATHVVNDGTGGNVPLNQHPTLASVDASSVGLNFGVRDLNSGIRSHPDYTQSRYINSVVQGVAASRGAFPNHQGFLAFFGFNDGKPGVPVDQQLIAILDSQYNSTSKPRLAFFVENLSDLGPTPLSGAAGSNLATWNSLGGDIMMQALDSWLQHQPDRDPQLMSLNPATGIALGFNNYHARFFELYVPDLDGAKNGALDASGRPILDDLTYWNSVLTSVPEPGASASVGMGLLLAWRRSRRRIAVL